MSKIAAKLRNRKETAYGLLALVLGPPLWIIIIAGAARALGSGNAAVAALAGTYIFYAVLIGVGVWIAALAYRATAFGNMLLLGPDQFPELHAMVVEAAQKLAMKTPTTFLFNSNGLVNAFARRILGGHYVFLTSALVEISDDEQVRFVIGHELGHHAAGHLNFWSNFLRAPAYAIPFLHPAYSRAREYTCDGIGAHLTGDLAISRSALQMLGCGCRRLNKAMRCDAFMAQEAMVPPVFGFLTEICRSHPRLTRRMAALKASAAIVI
jgi:Zn-dependent protease with chaperone function